MSFNNTYSDLESGYGEESQGKWSILQERYDPEADVRRGFIKKVYGILSFQLMITTGVCATFMKVEDVRDFVIRTPALMWVGFALSLVFLFALLAYRKSHPTNMVLLTIWTFIQSYTVGVICAVYSSEGKDMLVLQALGLTLGIFLGLTAFTFQSKINFSFMGAGLMLSLWTLILWSLMSWIMGWQTGFLFSLFGAMIFSGFIIYDTWRLSKQYSIDEYIQASIELYLDVINLFIYILRLLDRN
ncbi:hypothetical protein CYMTET_45215 [Cymbomonas tetramitiformis]|uniref:Uncharacterized protein n=1 Tax=Cymbomonas tetramitiformis TaxID=36881 RepID=A0AAE0C0G7_9CHLO|nr:hypothetical protein CYMTET_45215 [Cymbomonas tetramitiformis]|eukprot:gene29635-36924_t